MDKKLWREAKIGMQTWRIFLVDQTPEGDAAVTYPHIREVWIARTEDTEDFTDSVFHELQHVARSAFGIDCVALAVLGKKFEETWVCLFTPAYLSVLKAFEVLPNVQVMP